MDFVSPASYKVVPFQKTNPTKDISVIKDPAVPKSSPKGWHQSTKSFTVTQGNNAKVYSVVRPGGRRYFADGGESLDFVKNIDFSKAPTEGSNKDAAIINLFYAVNMMHDLSSEYGFDEAAGNFQDVNYGSEGLANDGVIARAQETSAYNTASFASVSAHFRYVNQV